MSRSYRKPYSTVVGVVSEKEDKRRANRNVRKAQNNYLKINWEIDEFLIPHKYECRHNDVWGWAGDGPKRYSRLATAWERYCRLNQQLFTSNWDEAYLNKYNSVFPPLWYIRLTRK